MCLIVLVNLLSISAQCNCKVARRSYDKYYELQLRVGEQKFREAITSAMFNLRLVGNWLKEAMMYVLAQINWKLRCALRCSAGYLGNGSGELQCPSCFSSE